MSTNLKDLTIELERATHYRDAWQAAEQRVRELERSRDSYCKIVCDIAEIIDPSTGTAGTPENTFKAVKRLVAERQKLEDELERQRAQCVTEAQVAIEVVVNDKNDVIRELERAVARWKVVGEHYEQQYATDIKPRLDAAERAVAECQGTELCGDPTKWGHKAIIDGLVEQRDTLEREVAWWKDSVDKITENQIPREMQQANRIIELELEVARLKDALQEMVDWTDCGCEDHASPDCCAARPSSEFHCAGCVASRALLT